MYHINVFCFLTENDIINDIDRFLSQSLFLVIHVDEPSHFDNESM